MACSAGHGPQLQAVRGYLRIDLLVYGRKVGLWVGWSCGQGGVGHALHRGWHALQKRLKRLKRPTVTCVSGPQRKKRNLGARNATQISTARCSCVGCPWVLRRRSVGAARGRSTRKGTPGLPPRAAARGAIFGPFSAVFRPFFGIFAIFYRSERPVRCMRYTLK